ncbi:uncharacterized protein BT62DRAFT_937016 [Guyanagaster necrorhizus]|uniref:Uncharacterized protein n=1 Tax=Guyanagaster necrorhizus TaxID=856835 RepID=A0A9P8AP48_9AGAR|nr:uncharacterized protein BT62DRAFT_937016 [Guyanagaster necrorhizus MCA 3950]KAG7441502.1 hypothetical protein BT62DRAFT_937016 [Guyanagaster necrorhizus MCA 3950]
MLTHRALQRARPVAAPVSPRSLIQTRSPEECNPQTASPLFSTIPPEIRNIIFQLALCSYPDESRAYPGNAYCFRPGYEYYQRIDTDLLLTCHRVYNETRLLPVIGNEHVFWCHRGPPGSSARPAVYFGKMTKEQQDVIDCVHFFTQLYWLEGTFPAACSIAEMRPRKVKITIRHSDWWYWENNHLLVLKDGWTNEIRLLKRLEEFEIELETFERNKDQMLAIAQRIRNWNIDLWDGRVLSTKGHSLVHDHWRGTSVFADNIGYDRENNSWTRRSRVVRPVAPLVYNTVTLKWTAVAKV